MLGWFQKFEKLIDIPHSMLVESGIKCVMIDMDSTLLVWHGKEVGDAEKVWCEKAVESGLDIVIVSNAIHERTGKIAESIGVKFIAPAMKPFPFGLWKAQKLMKANKKNCVMVGDQLITDRIAAFFAGIRFVLVEPLSNIEFGVTRFNRKVEKFLFGRDTDK